MKKTKEIVLYDDTENYKKFDETRDFLFEVYADENGWACKENIPDDEVYKEIDFQNQETWRDLKDALENSFKTRYYLMTGTCGRWNGNFDGGTFITCYRDFQSMIQHLDNIKVIDRNGHLIIEGYHHDGSDRYELKRKIIYLFDSTQAKNFEYLFPAFACRHIRFHLLSLFLALV